MRIGYACLNMTLRDLGFKRRRLFKSQFESDINNVTQAAAENIETLAKMIGWNEEHGIKFLRITDLFPWMDHYSFESLPNWPLLLSGLSVINQVVRKWNHRITVHPSSFCVLASPNESSRINTIRELNANGQLFDHFGFDRTPFNKINIHVGGIYDDKMATMDRWCSSFELLDESVRSRLTIENDDGPNGYTVQDLYDGVYRRLGIPIVMDLFHHRLNPGELSESEALHLALNTWSDITPVVHLSSSKRDYENPDSPKISHADYIYRELPVFEKDVDVMVEAKKTELAVLRLLK